MTVLWFHKKKFIFQFPIYQQLLSSANPWNSWIVRWIFLFYFNCMVWHIYVMQTKRMVTLFEFNFIMEWFFHSFTFWIITKSKILELSKSIGNLVIQLRWNNNSHWYTTKLEWNLIWFNYFISSLSKRGTPHFFPMSLFLCYFVLYNSFFCGIIFPEGEWEEL